MFKNISFIKVDYIVFLEFVFKEVSIMYIFKENEMDTDDMIKKLTDDYLHNGPGRGGK
jgi:hypothetical protein